MIPPASATTPVPTVVRVGLDTTSATVDCVAVEATDCIRRAFAKRLRSTSVVGTPAKSTEEAEVGVESFAVATAMPPTINVTTMQTARPPMTHVTRWFCV